MKRLFLFFVMCAFAFVANAQVRTFYNVEDGYWVKVDLNKKEFLQDGCGVDAEPIKNYKKVGNKESFTTYDGGYTTHHELVKKSDTEYTYTYWITPSETIEKATREVTTKKPTGDGYDSAVPGSTSEKVGADNPVKNVGDKVKGLFNKGKSLFKKDKGGSDSKSAKTSTSKSNKTTRQHVDDGSMPEK